MAANKNRKPNPSLKDETAEQKFVRLANMRVSKALKALTQIGRLGAKTYSSTDEQRARIMTAIKERVQLVEDQLNQKPVRDESFKL